MRILKYKHFAQWLKDEKISDEALRLAANELISGLFDANLGGNVYKKKVSRVGQGKRDGYRTLIAFKHNKRAIFILGFAKNERANITPQEKAVLKRVAKDYLSITDSAIDKLIKVKELIELIEVKL